MWNEPGRGGPTDEDRDRRAATERGWADLRRVEAARQTLARERARQRTVPVRRRSFHDVSEGEARAMLPAAVVMVFVLVAVGIVWAIVKGVQAEREFTRDCEGKGGWVERDVGGQWVTVPVTSTDAQGRTTTTWQQQYRPGPTYCVVDGKRVGQL